MGSMGGGARPQGLPSKLLYEDFIFQNTLGEGQYGAVWRCVDRRTGETFACKQMNKAKHPKSVDRESICFVRVQSHPNVVRLDQLYEDEESIYFLMEMCTGGDLLPVICQSGGLDEGDSAAIFCQLVQAVQHCHSRGVIHRDIKPENVLLDMPVDGIPTVKLADFGLATMVRKGRMAQGWVGSPPYEAPEVIDLKPYDFKADVWSLGIVLYGMLSANWPSFLQGRKFNRRVDFQAPVWESVSVQAKELITRMLATDPANRPSATEILEDIWMTSHLPASLAARLAVSSMEVEVEGVEVNPMLVPPPVLPIDFLPPLGRQPPHVAPYKRGLPVEAEGSKTEKAARTSQQGDGSFGSWQEVNSAGGPWEQPAVKSAPAPVPVPAPAAVTLFVPHMPAPAHPPAPAAAHFPAPYSTGGGAAGCCSTGNGDLSHNGWKAVSLSRSQGCPLPHSSAPAAEPCSSNSFSPNSSSPASPESKPLPPQHKSPSITKQIGKRLMALVSGTLAANPMCAKMIPSASTGDSFHCLDLSRGSEPKRTSTIYRDPEIRRPSTAFR